MIQHVLCKGDGTAVMPEQEEALLLRRRSRYFVRGAFRRFYVPALLSSFWLAVAGVADSIFVGNGIGSAGLAAISLGQPVYLFYNILSYGFSIGGSIRYSSALAEGRAEGHSRGNPVFPDHRPDRRDSGDRIPVPVPAHAARPGDSGDRQ